MISINDSPRIGRSIRPNEHHISGLPSRDVQCTLCSWLSMSASGQGRPTYSRSEDPPHARPSAFHAAERVLVTGASGFIGTNVVDACLRHEITVANLDPLPPRNEAHHAVWEKIDPLDAIAVSSVVTAFDPTLVFHLGARTDLHGRTLSDYAHNVEGLRVIIDACNAAPSVRRVIFASSRLVCRIGYQPTGEDDYCPTTPYGESKMVGEQIVRQADHSYEWLIVRPTSIWGPWFAVPYRDFFDAISRGHYFHIKGQAVRKSFGYVGNTVYELERLAYAPADALQGRTLYLGDYPPTDVREMADLIQRYAAAPTIRTIPRWPLALAAGIGDLLQRAGWSEPPLTKFRLNNLTTEMVYDMTPLRDAVGPLPYSLAQGVHETVTWIRQQDGSSPESARRQSVPGLG
jgi:nucleoside-diphosphate-sugar epimerase